MKIYICGDTGIINEEVYSGRESGFCIVEEYEHAYQKELPRFQKINFNILGSPPYALPYEDIPRKKYLGIGNVSLSKDSEFYCDYNESLPHLEVDAIEIRNKFFADETDLVWIKIYGSAIAMPEGYSFYGYDISFVPEIEGAFSIINDCMFICKWHGCDNEGSAFLKYFDSLNENGLFNDADTAFGYMKYYLSFDWTERGEYCICEIYRKN